MLRVQISESMSRHERFHIIDGMSLEVCGPSRSSSAKIVGSITKLHRIKAGVPYGKRITVE